MIDEEEPDAILNEGISFKSVLKNILVICLILAGAMMIYFGSGDMMTNWIIGFMLICFGSTLMQIQKEQPDPIRQTLTILSCVCGLTKVRNYERGDYVFNKVGSCDKCNETMEIKQIYSVKLKTQTEPNKPEKKETSEKSLEAKEEIKTV